MTTQSPRSCRIVVASGLFAVGLLVWIMAPYLNTNMAVRCQMVDTSKSRPQGSNIRRITKSEQISWRSEDNTLRQKDLSVVMLGYMGPGVDPDDPELIRRIRKYFIDVPRPYVTKFSRLVIETPQSKEALNYLKGMKNGFFLECGALDGVRSSNSIYLEQAQGWNGLLVEMDPSYYLQIRGKNRKCYTMNACLSPETYPEKMQFREHKMGQGRLITDPAAILQNSGYVYDTYCFPLYSMMLALNRTKIDYLSLDVEGFELPILQTIPFEKLDISVMTVEFKHGRSKEDMVHFLRNKGYRMVKTLTYSEKDMFLYGSDYLFVKESLLI